MVGTIAERTPRRGEGVNGPINRLEKFRKYKGGRKCRKFGSVVIPKNVHVTPFSPEGLINPILSTRFPGGPERANGLPGGHPDLDGGHLGLLENFSSGILVIEVFPAPFRPEEVEILSGSLL
jgi:hypothetical protein